MTDLTDHLSPQSLFQRLELQAAFDRNLQKRKQIIGKLNLAMQNVKPVRIQRTRKSGGGMKSTNGLPVVYVGRGSDWGNPFRVRLGRVNEAVAYFGAYAAWRSTLLGQQTWLLPLRGKNLACWCALTDKKGDRVSCHADILLELANRPEAEGNIKLSALDYMIAQTESITFRSEIATLGLNPEEDATLAEHHDMIAGHLKTKRGLADFISHTPTSTAGKVEQETQK